MTSPNNIGLSASFDASQAISEFNKFNTVLRSTQQAILAASLASKNFPTLIEDEATAISKSATAYSKIIGLGRQYAATQQALAKATKDGATGSLRLASTLNQLQKAMSKVGTTTKATYDGQARTLALYQQLISLSAQAALVKQREAAATKSLAGAEARRSTTGLKKSGSTAVAANLEDQKKADQEATQATKAATAAEQQRSQAVTKSAESQDILTGKLASTRYALYQVAAGYAAVSAALETIPVMAVKVATSYQTAFAQVERTTNATRSQLGGLYDDLESLSTTIPSSFEDLSKIASLGAQLGIANADIKDFTSTVAQFAATSNVSAEDASTAFGRLSNLLNIPAEQFENLGSAVAELGVNSAATESEILQVAQSIAPIANTAGLSAEAVLGLSSAFASLKVSPELARSMMTRFFVTLDKNLASGKDSLTGYANILGMTVDQTEQLAKTDPEKFFLSIVQGMQHTVKTGGDLTSQLASIGVTSVRDIPIFQRLANSFDLVSSSVAQAYSSYSSGSFLNEASAKVFDTLSAKVTELANAFKNLVSGGFEPALAPVGAVVGWLTDLLKLFNGLPSWVKTSTVAFLALAGAFAAYKAASALGIAGLIAFRQVMQEGVNTGTIGAKLLLKEWSETFGKNALAARASAAESNAAINSTTATITAQTEALVANTTAQRANAVAAGTDAAAQTAGAVARTGSGLGYALSDAGIAAGAAKLGGVGSKIGSFAKSLPGIATAIAAVSLAAGVLTSVFGDAGDAAEDAASKIQQARQDFIDAGGGIDSLADAIKADTDAWKEAGNQSTAQNGVFAVTNALVAKNASVVKDSADTTGDWAKVIGNISDTMPGVSTAVDNVSKSVADQTVALGKNVKAWEQNALQKYLSDNPVITATQLQQFNEAGIDITKAIAAGLQGGTPAFDSAIENLVPEVKAKLQGLKGELAAAMEDATYGSNDPNDDPTVKKIRSQVDAYQAMLDVIAEVRGKVGTASDAVSNALADGSVLVALFKQLGIDLPTDDYDDFTAATNGAADSTETLADKLRDAASAFQDLISGMFDGIDAQSQLADAFANLGESIAENGTDFSLLTDAGRKNLDALGAVVNGYAQVLAGYIESGQMSAQDAAAQMQQYMVSLVQQLSQIGVPTDQIDFLVKYLGSVTGADWKVGVGADISGAVSGIDTVREMLAGLAADTNVVARASGVSPAALVAAGTYDQYRTATAVPKYSGPTVFGGGGSTGDLDKIFNTAGFNKQQELVKQRADAIASANDKAADSATKAGKAQEQAAKDASDALAKQEQYVKDLADYYRQLGKSTMSLIDAEGGTYEALQKIGASLQENGVHFNTFTQTGRDNFSALEDSISSFGDVLGTQVEGGLLSATQASAQMKQFLSGVYSELIKMGVPQKEIATYFKAMGADTSGWKNATASVKQYDGVLTAATKAAREAAKASEDTSTKAQKAAEALSDYVQRLSDALDTQYSKMFGVAEAADSTTKSWQSLADQLQSNIDKVKELRQQNEDLKASIAEQSVTANKAYIEYKLSLKYGEADRAADYKQQYEAAQQKIKQDQDQIKTNTKQADTLEKNNKQLKGNSKEAIANRDALRGLSQSIASQIEAYAKQGHTQQEVQQYTRTLTAQFKAQATQLGFTKDQVQPYIDKINSFKSVVGSIKKDVAVKVTATANTDPATKALNSIKKTGTYRVTASTGYVDVVTKKLNAIPKRSDYKVTAKADTSAATKSINNIGKGKTATIPAKVNVLPWSLGSKKVDASLDQKALDNSWNAFVKRIRKANPSYGDKDLMAPVWRGGFIGNGMIKGGYAYGGLVPGTPPANPQQDNLLARGPDGMYTIRSQEYVQPEKAVRYYGVDYMNAIRDLRIPRDAMWGGGVVGAGAAGVLGNGGLGDMLIVQLSPEDRRLMMASGDRPIVVQFSDRAVAESAKRGGVAKARVGSG